ncbi:hypothetical protein D3C87_2107150 [compost metagenome]
MDLHDHAIFDREQRHFGHHLRAEQFRVMGIVLAGQNFVEQGLLFDQRQIGGIG